MLSWLEISAPGFPCAMSILLSPIHLLFIHMLSDCCPHYRLWPAGLRRGVTGRCSRTLWITLQPAGTAPAWQGVGKGTWLSWAHTAVISRLSSSKTHGLTPSGPNDLWKLNLSARSEIPGCLPQIPPTLLTNLLQTHRVSKAPHCLQQWKSVQGNWISFLLLSPQKVLLLHLYPHSAVTGLILNFNVSEGGK